MDGRARLRPNVLRLTVIGFMALGACGDNSRGVCMPLFGAPTANTGLSSAECQASCQCAGDFSPRSFSAAQIDALSERTIDVELEPLASNPYLDMPGEMATPTSVCTVIEIDATAYRLETFSSADAAMDANALVTHEGECGQCSTLQDLAVYLRTPDLATPVRQCGIDNLGAGEPEITECLRAIGFTEACAQIWAFNTLNTQDKCLTKCLAALDEPYHLEDGTLNPCIQCDEDESGPVFKAIAGRTRRNSGIASALCRPCESVAPVSHDYIR